MVKTRVKDIVQVLEKKQKWKWTGHIARMNDNRWATKITDWCPSEDERSKKQHDTRWRDAIEHFAGNTSQRLDQNRELCVS